MRNYASKFVQNNITSVSSSMNIIKKEEVKSNLNKIFDSLIVQDIIIQRKIFLNFPAAKIFKLLYRGSRDGFKS